MAAFCTAINPACAASAERTLIVIGDSLTAGLGLPLHQAFPAQLERRLRAQKYAVKVINAGVSGETTSGTLSRLEWTLSQKADAVILETGANDMLLFIDPATTERNFDALLQRLSTRKIPVLVTGMKAFANLGPEYAKRYESIFGSYAQKYHMLYYPFFLEGVALNKALLQADGLHPNAAGVSVIVDRILPSVEKLLKK